MPFARGRWLDYQRTRGGSFHSLAMPGLPDWPANNFNCLNKASEARSKSNGRLTIRDLTRSVLFKVATVFLLSNVIQLPMTIDAAVHDVLSTPLRWAPLSGCLDKCGQYSIANVTASSQLPIIFSHYPYIVIRNFLSATASAASATNDTILLQGRLLNVANAVLRRNRRRCCTW